MLIDQNENIVPNLQCFYDRILYFTFHIIKNVFVSIVLRLALIHPFVVGDRFFWNILRFLQIPCNQLFLSFHEQKQVIQTEIQVLYRVINWISQNQFAFLNAIQGHADIVIWILFNSQTKHFLVLTYNSMRYEFYL